MNRENKIKKLKRFLQENYPNIQAFNTRNLVGDYMKNVYAEDGIVVDYCEDYDYIEIFGLSQVEFDSLLKVEKWGEHLKTFTFKDDVLEKESNLKSKLEELGYEINDFIEDDDLDSDCTFTGEKYMGRGIYIVIGLLDENKLMGYVYDRYQIHKNEERLKVLELAIEAMKKDLSILKECEE